MMGEYRGRQIHVDEAGSGPCLLLLHGIGADAETWSELRGRWAARFRVLAWDAPGYHRSDDPDGAFRPEDYGRAAAAVLEAKGAGPAVVVGHSFGGLVAMELAQARPALVAGLVLIDASLGHATKPPAERDELLARRIRAVTEDGPEAMARRRTPEILSAAAPASIRQDVERIMRRVRAPGYIAAARAIHAADGLRAVETYRGPLLIVWGNEDRVTPLSDLDRLLRVHPESDVLRVPRSAHLPYLEASSLVGEAVERFSARVFGLA